VWNQNREEYPWLCSYCYRNVNTTFGNLLLWKNNWIIWSSGFNDKDCFIILIFQYIPKLPVDSGSISARYGCHSDLTTQNVSLVFKYVHKWQQNTKVTELCITRTWKIKLPFHLRWVDFANSETPDSHFNMS